MVPATHPHAFSLLIFNEYSFVNSLRNPPDDAGVAKIDLVVRIEVLDQEEMNSMFQFYTAVHQIVDSANDTHLQFLTPFHNIAVQYFPYDLSMDATDPPTLFLREFRGNTNLSEGSKSKLGFYQISAKVRNMSLNSESNPTKTPFDVLSDWAEENIASPKKETNRFNRTILDDFAIRKALEPQTADFIVIVTLANGEQKTVPVPFGACIATDEPIADLEETCFIDEPLDPTPQSNSDSSTPIITSEFSFTSAVIPAEKIGSVHIGSFSEQAHGTAIAFVQSLKGFVVKKSKKLVLDLRGNTGGSISLMIQLMELLWPHRIPHCPA
ncbi:hypothetical protein BLNAU_1404 [Blattamonas nauphoetae]|uniref:Tail specific protease domain-containing protein n=1 Tax=Blattamonas nauphoetae TaxID=2049346 RepID=A0ABQ9YJ99_9EUKA|nr:hypothetical protein BLNAU_1404 [Blattamonas nauphoetae]